MALQAPANYSLNLPDPLQAFQQGQMWRDQQMQRQASQQKAQELQAAVASLPPSASIAQINEVLFKYPELTERFKGQVATLTEQERQRKMSESIPVYAAMVSGNPSVAENIMRNRAEALRNAGNEVEAKNAEAMAELIKTSPGTASTSMGMMLSAITDPEKFAETFGKLEENRRAEQLQPEKLKEIQNKNIQAANGAGFKVQRADILPNGTTVMVGEDGTRQVRDAAGNVIDGTDAALAIDQAQNYGVNLEVRKAGGAATARGAAEAAAAPAIAGGGEAGRSGIQTANEAFKIALKVSANIPNLRRARELAANGVNTGAIASRLPNWSAGAVELANLRNQLGLDVIGTAAFGALSEGELNLALNTALPVNLNQDELVKWIDRKIAAQEKARMEYLKVAQFLSKPGNTLDKWLEKSGIAPAATPAGTAPVNDLAAAAAAELARRRGGG